jgi:hypothetical protein
MSECANEPDVLNVAADAMAKTRPMWCLRIERPRH